MACLAGRRGYTGEAHRQNGHLKLLGVGRNKECSHGSPSSIGIIYRTLIVTFLENLPPEKPDAAKGQASGSARVHVFLENRRRYDINFARTYLKPAKERNQPR
jgi:hypothetical protein